MVRERSTWVEVLKFIFKSKRNFANWLSWSVSLKLTLQRRFKVQFRPIIQTEWQSRQSITWLFVEDRQKLAVGSKIMYFHSACEFIIKANVLRWTSCCKRWKRFTFACTESQTRPVVISDGEKFRSWVPVRTAMGLALFRWLRRYTYNEALEPAPALSGDITVSLKTWLAGHTLACTLGRLVWIQQRVRSRRFNHKETTHVDLSLLITLTGSATIPRVTGNALRYRPY